MLFMLGLTVELVGGNLSVVDQFPNLRPVNLLGNAEDGSRS